LARLARSEVLDPDEVADRVTFDNRTPAVLLVWERDPILRVKI